MSRSAADPGGGRAGAWLAAARETQNGPGGKRVSEPAPDPVQPAVCVCCRLSGESCDCPYLAGRLAGAVRTGGGLSVRIERSGAGAATIFVPPEAGSDRAIALLERVAGGEAPPALGIAFFHLAATSSGWRYTPNSLVVLEPDWLFSVSDATQFEYCERQRLVALHVANPPGLPLLRGILVHQLFPRLWRGCSEAELEEALAAALAEQALKIGMAGLDPEAVAADARRHLARLKRWADGLSKASELVSETFRLAPGWGLKGRIDAVWERPGRGPVLLGELKTGRSRGRRAARAATASGEAEQGHLFQLVSYAAMVTGRGETGPDPLQACLLYSGNPELGGRQDLIRRVVLDIGTLRDAVAIRNRLVLLELGETPQTPAHPAACAACRCARDCATLGRLAGLPAVPAAPAVADPEQDPAGDPESRCFRHYAGLIRAERAAVRAEMARLWTCEPAARVAEGRALRLAGRVADDSADEPGRRYRVAGDNQSEFRPGDTVLLADAAGPVRGRCALGVITELGIDQVTLAWEGEPGFEPVWVDGYPDEALTRRQLAALYRFLSRPSPLRELLVRRRRAAALTGPVPDLSDVLAPAIRERLAANPPQREALEQALRAETLFRVAGPPGSGKTVLIGALAAAAARLPGGGRVLLVAVTNRALDQALERVVEAGGPALAVVRLGRAASAAPGVRSRMPAARVQEAGSLAAGCRAAAAWVREAAVVGVTASALAGGDWDAVLGDFDRVVVDEASQMTVPLGLGAASYGRRLIVIGDDRQLPPVVRAPGGATDEWPDLSVSLFELVRGCLASGPAPGAALERQFRMSDGVGAAPAAVWYDGRLRPGTPAVAARALAVSPKWEQHPMAAALDPARPVAAVSVAGAARARTNDAEARWVADWVAALDACGAGPGRPGGPSLAVISPYRAQVARIRRELGVRFPERRALWQASVDTVDRFQGSEADVVVVSCCPPPAPSDHLADERRLNVALTRGRCKLVLLGDQVRLEAYPVFRRLFAEYEARWPGAAWRVDAAPDGGAPRGHAGA